MLSFWPGKKSHKPFFSTYSSTNTQYNPRTFSAQYHSLEVCHNLSKRQLTILSVLTELTIFLRRLLSWPALYPLYMCSAFATFVQLLTLVFDLVRMLELISSPEPLCSLHIQFFHPVLQYGGWRDCLPLSKQHTAGHGRSTCW